MSYPLGDVLLYVESGREDGLQISLFADSKDLTQAGFAVNCLTLHGATKIGQGLFDSDEDKTDGLNEIQESVICQPGAVLELDWLRLAFGSVENGVVGATLEASCHKSGEQEEMQVVANFDALIIRRAEREEIHERTGRNDAAGDAGDAVYERGRLF